MYTSCKTFWMRASAKYLNAPPQGNAIESEHLSELTEEEYEAHIYQRQDLKGFMWLDAKYLNPFFTRRLTQEVKPHPQLSYQCSLHCPLRPPNVPSLPPSI